MGARRPNVKNRRDYDKVPVGVRMKRSFHQDVDQAGKRFSGRDNEI
jgi:hypothetical protein